MHNIRVTKTNMSNNQTSQTSRFQTIFETSKPTIPTPPITPITHELPTPKKSFVTIGRFLVYLGVFSIMSSSAFLTANAAPQNNHGGGFNHPVVSMVVKWINPDVTNLENFGAKKTDNSLPDSYFNSSSSSSSSSSVYNNADGKAAMEAQKVPKNSPVVSSFSSFSSFSSSSSSSSSSKSIITHCN